MDSTSKYGWSGPRAADTKGSVRRAREMLEVGRRPKVRAPQDNSTVPPQPRPRIVPQPNAWPLLGDNESKRANMADPHGRLSGMVDAQGRLLVSRGTPPPRPARPDLPSPSIYSERSVSEFAPSPLHPQQRRTPSFSQPFVNQQNIHPALRESAPVTNEDMSRKSATSSTGSIPFMTDFPPPLPPQNKTSHLAPPNPMRSGMDRRSSVSPIPEELPDSPTILNKPYGPKRVTASSWNSEQRESDILGAYMDGDSDSAQGSPEHGEVTLVRQASLGKRGKPSLRTISKPNVETPQLAGRNGETGTQSEQTNDANLKEIVVGLATRDSFGSDVSKESGIDPEKPPIVRGEDMSTPHSYDDNMRSLGIENLPQRAPTLSEMRPGARRPPRLNMSAVRDAEARGSLTSLSDLIKRATRLATNLEHGRTASRNDLLNVGGGSRYPFGHPNRQSGSIKDILASFPNPAATPEGHRSSWPIFWRRSTLHQLNSQERGQESNRDQEKGNPQQRRRCCGMPMWAFITLCIILLIIIAAAVLIPIFLVVVPRQNQNTDNCEKTAPCSNGGVSVSSGDTCSCVCVNGYTGSGCTTAGDASCVTTGITQNSTSRNATIGDDVPRLFQVSKDNFSIPLDPVTIVALFSQNNVSCTTENALVSFKGLSPSENTRRSISSDLVNRDPMSQGNEEPEASTVLDVPTATIPVRREIATKHGIVFEDSHSNDDSDVSISPKMAEPSPTPTTKAVEPSTTPSFSTEVLDFSRVAVLYIFQKTGTLDAAMSSAESLQTHLEHSSSNSTSGNFMLDLKSSGVKGNVTLNFDDFTITDFDGEIVGGD